MKLQGKNILITGGASGIGRLMGRIAITKGAKSIIIWDINEENIQKVVAEHDELAATTVSVTKTTATKSFGYKVDVSDNELVRSTYAKVKEEVGQVDVLINCAGIVTSNRWFAENSPEEIERTMRINTVAPMYVALAMIGDMIARDSGHICNIASAAGMLSLPRMSAYAASKWAVVGWSDSVRIELQEQHSKVRITTIAPYFINTGMFDGVQSKIFPFHFIRFWQGVLPTRFFDWFFGTVFGIYHVMDHFTGRRK